jgi:cell division protein FtsB
MFFLVIATLLYAFVFGDGGIIRIMTLRHEKASLEDNIAMVDHDIESLRLEIDRLKNDPFAMEKLGRERYGYVYPGDRVYKIIHPTR